MLPPNNPIGISKNARETVPSEAILYRWKKQAKANGLIAPDELEPERWSTQDKFHVVVETAKMSQTELAQYYREKGLFVEQVKQWRDACMQGVVNTFPDTLLSDTH